MGEPNELLGVLEGVGDQIDRHLGYPELIVANSNVLLLQVILKDQVDIFEKGLHLHDLVDVLDDLVKVEVHPLLF